MLCGCPPTTASYVGVAKPSTPWGVAGASGMACNLHLTCSCRTRILHKVGSSTQHPGSVGFLQDKVENWWFVPFPWSPGEPGAFKGVEQSGCLPMAVKKSRTFPGLKVWHGCRLVCEWLWPPGGRWLRGSALLLSSCPLSTPECEHPWIEVWVGRQSITDDVLCCALSLTSVWLLRPHGLQPARLFWQTGILQARILEWVAMRNHFPTPHCRRILYWLNHQSSFLSFPEAGLTLRVPCRVWCHKCLFTCLFLPLD